MKKTTFSALFPFFSGVFFAFRFYWFLYFEICYSRQMLRHCHFAHRKDLPSATRCVSVILLFSSSVQVENLRPQREILDLYGFGFDDNNNNKKSAVKVNECVRTSRNYVSECFMQANNFSVWWRSCFAIRVCVLCK